MAEALQSSLVSAASFSYNSSPQPIFHRRNPFPSTPLSNLVKRRVAGAASLAASPAGLGRSLSSSSFDSVTQIVQSAYKERPMVAVVEDDRSAWRADESALSVRLKRYQLMEKEIKELREQRDLAQQRIRDLIQSVGDNHVSLDSLLLANTEQLVELQSNNLYTGSSYSISRSSSTANFFWMLALIYFG